MTVRHVQLSPHPVYFGTEKDHLGLIFFHAALLFPPICTINFFPETHPFDLTTFIISHHPPGLVPPYHWCQPPPLVLLLFPSVLYRHAFAYVIIFPDDSPPRLSYGSLYSCPLRLSMATLW